MTNYAQRTVTESDMTTLRDRIAALLELLRPVTPVEAADAVIAELQLKPLALGAEYNAASTRYITGWINND